MRLLTITAEYTVELDKPWIMMVPEFATILRKDKGSEGDYRGDKKLYARKRLGFVYLMHDFSSPLRTWDPFDKREEALRWCGLTEKDFDEDLAVACNQYQKMCYNAARALKTVETMYKTLDKIDTYFETVDPAAVDNKGELKYDMGKVMDNIAKAQKTYAALHSFEKMVEEQLTQDSGIRGQAEKGDREGKERNWEYDGRKGFREAPAGKVDTNKPGLSSWSAAAEQIKKLEQTRERVQKGAALADDEGAGDTDDYMISAFGTETGGNEEE